MSAPTPYLSIAAVERETGLSKDVLRKWETRYGFPAPLRDAQGERAYPPDQVHRLRLIKRLMDTGMRPSRLVSRDAEALAALASERSVSTGPTRGRGLGPGMLELLRGHDPEGLREQLYRLLLRHGVGSFVQDIIIPLNQAVGETWSRGELAIHEEHLYTEAAQWVLRNVVASLSDRRGRPRVLLTTLPEEPHGLGILTVAAMLALDGAYCISLGPRTPMEEIASAVRAHSVDVVALSFSVLYAPRRIPPALAELRQRLPPGVEIWAGGAGTARVPRGSVADARLMHSVEDAREGSEDWRARHGAPSSPATRTGGAPSTLP